MPVPRTSGSGASATAPIWSRTMLKRDRPTRP